MTKEQLKNKCYLVATGAFLTKRLTFEEYDYITEEELEDLLWEAVERYGASHVSYLIENLADDIKAEFEEFVDE